MGPGGTLGPPGLLRVDLKRRIRLSVFVLRRQELREKQLPVSLIIPDIASLPSSHLRAVALCNDASCFYRWQAVALTQIRRVSVHASVLTDNNKTKFFCVWINEAVLGQKKKQQKVRISKEKKR